MSSLYGLSVMLPVLLSHKYGSALDVLINKDAASREQIYLISLAGWVLINSSSSSNDLERNLYMAFTLFTVSSLW